MKINGVDIDEINKLTDNIKTHYGSLNTFSIVTGYSYGKIKAALLNLEFTKQTYDEIQAAYTKHLNKDKVPFRISEENVNKIRICIYTNFKKVRHFCRKHPEYTEVFMSNLLNGKSKLESPRYKRLEILLINKYNLKLEE